MEGESETPNYEYVAYIDEAGDLGLKRLRPMYPKGSSEWFILAATVVSRENEECVKAWVQEMLEASRGRQKPGRRQTLHFRNLNPAHQGLVCEMLATKPVRCFVVASHKKSLLTWRPSSALVQMNNRDWYYNFLTRYLLERITWFVTNNAQKTHGGPRKLKVVFSERNGLNTGQLGVYLERLRNQTRYDTVVLKRGNLKWEAFEFSLLRRANHNVSAGLQLADIVASSFFRACDHYHTLDCNPEYAQLLGNVMARQPDKSSGLAAGFGVKVLPGYKPDEWLPLQSKVFAHFGYPKEWWAPVPSTPPHG
jgi:hypothetical protein